jgi:2-polyprenyl-3-methyl-5-hydroxy-6-metoxy-1,4-benzoquinol methylase
MDFYKKTWDEYPEQAIRLNFIVKILKQKKINNIFDVGCGTGGPMIKMLNNKIKAEGGDFAEKMVSEGKKELLKAGYNPKLISPIDLEDKKTLPKKKYNSVLALGVFPHILNQKTGLKNINFLLKKNGSAFISFRNDLFALSTLNEYSLDLFLNRMFNIKVFPKKIQQEVLKFYADRLKTTVSIKKENGAVKYTSIMARFHNPLTLEEELFKPCGFAITKIHFYHYHALPTFFQKKYKKIYDRESLKLEKTNDWKGNFLASAFVVEAKKIK